MQCKIDGFIVWTNTLSILLTLCSKQLQLQVSLLFCLVFMPKFLQVLANLEHYTEGENRLNFPGLIVFHPYILEFSPLLVLFSLARFPWLVTIEKGIYLHLAISFLIPLSSIVELVHFRLIGTQQTWIPIKKTLEMFWTWFSRFDLISFIYLGTTFLY